MIEFEDSCLPFRAEYATFPQICDRCNDLIDEMSLCLSKSVTLICLNFYKKLQIMILNFIILIDRQLLSTSFDAENPPRFHLDCFFAPTKSKMRSRPNTHRDIQQFAMLKATDQEKIKRKIELENIASAQPHEANVNIENFVDDIIPTSKLEIPVQELLKEVLNPNLQTLVGDQYQQRNLPKPDFMLDLDKMPWGRLKHGVIEEACKVLQEVLNLLENNVNLFHREIEDLTFNFSIIIIQNFGTDFSTPLLNNPDPLYKIKLRVLKFFLDSMLGYLLLIQIDNTSYRHHSPAPMDSQYINLQCHITTLDRESNMGKLITKYFILTTAGSYTIDNIFTLERYDEDKRFEPFQNQRNRKLLWHASNIANFVGILSTGLRMSQAKGGAHGIGIYFADAAQKSIPYARSGRHVLLLLCEVALGVESSPRIPASPGNSMKYRGSYYPDPSQYDILANGTVVPCGPLLGSGSSFNEYIVQDEAQVKLRYLVQISKT